MLRERLMELRAAHRELDQQIAEIELAAAHDQLSMTRLKKQKLVAQGPDHATLEDRLFPDIIA